MHTTVWGLKQGTCTRWVQEHMEHDMARCCLAVGGRRRGVTAMEERLQADVCAPAEGQQFYPGCECLACACDPSASARLPTPLPYALRHPVLSRPGVPHCCCGPTYPQHLSGSRCVPTHARTPAG